MAWDDTKVDGATDGTGKMPASEWNTHVTDQKTRQTAAQVNALIAAYANIGLVKTGTYDGDNTQNRAIPHGLGKTPDFILIARYKAGAGNLYMKVGTSYFVYNGGYAGAVTVQDATNFYVGEDGAGGSTNPTTYTHAWIAITRTA